MTMCICMYTYCVLHEHIQMRLYAMVEKALSATLLTIFLHLVGSLTRASEGC